MYVSASGTHAAPVSALTCESTTGSESVQAERVNVSAMRMERRERRRMVNVPGNPAVWSECKCETRGDVVVTSRTASLPDCEHA
jgi:hypothetical protein